MLSELLDLVLPMQCGGCGRAGVGWCSGCAGALAGPPRRTVPRLDPGIPCWHLADYDGPRRSAIIAAKEHGRKDLVAVFGTALRRGLERLRNDGDIPAGPLLLVPAPTRRWAARVRGGDPVARFAAVAAGLVPGCATTVMLMSRRGSVDSVGLSARARRVNLAGRVQLVANRPRPNCPIILVDDVMTTGATACESVRVLTAAGYDVIGVVTLTAA